MRFLTLQVMGAVMCGQNPKCREVENARKMPGSVVFTCTTYLRDTWQYAYNNNNTHIISAEAAFRTVSRRRGRARNCARKAGRAILLRP